MKAPEKNRDIDDYSLEELKKCRQTAADVVARYGKKFLPIFRQMDKAVEEREEEEKALEKALAMARLRDR